jgi:hypothetical protein
MYLADQRELICTPTLGTSIDTNFEVIGAKRTAANLCSASWIGQKGRNVAAAITIGDGVVWLQETSAIDSSQEWADLTAQRATEITRCANSDIHCVANQFTCGDTREFFHSIGIGHRVVASHRRIESNAYAGKRNLVTRVRRTSATKSRFNGLYQYG